jgi:polyhydroxybutyrate depolymerase
MLFRLRGLCGDARVEWLWPTGHRRPMRRAVSTSRRPRYTVPPAAASPGRLSLVRLISVLLVLLAGTPGAQAQPNTTHSLVHQNLERRFVLHSPPDAARSGPRPLVVVLHGSGQPLKEVRDWLPIHTVADREGFFVAYPEAVGGRWNYGELPNEKIDDPGFIEEMIQRLVADGTADPARIYVVGISRGALLTWTLLCRQPGRFVAAAALSSGMTDAHLAGCTPARLVPIVVIAGTADSVQPYDGWIEPPPAARLLSIPETMEFWRRAHRCTAQTLWQLPHRTGGDASVAHRIRWTNCTRGGPVTLFRIVGGEHEPPTRSRGQDIDADEEVWRFFRENTPATR